MRIARYILLAAGLLIFPATISAGDFEIVNLKVQGHTEPLAVEDARPVFGWQMRSSRKGAMQGAYRLEVKRSRDGATVWDTGRRESGLSDNIKYLGVALQPECGYDWEVTVWDGDGDRRTAISRFETGLMNPGLSAWEGAQWIGTRRLRLDAASLNYFRLSASFVIETGDKASLVLGANDFRLKDGMQNAYGMAGENYVRLEIDLSGVGKAAGAALNIYRVGYAAGDSEQVPFLSINAVDFPRSNINEIFTGENRHEMHTIEVWITTSNIQFVIDGKELITEAPSPAFSGNGFSVGNVTGPETGATAFRLGPWGATHDYNSLPHLACIGFAAMPGCRVVYTDYTIRTSGQSETDIVFDRECYPLFGQMGNVTVEGERIIVENSGPDMTVAYADPSHGAVPMLRSEFVVEEAKTVSKARLYVTSLGANEMFINGVRVGEDWFTPGSSQFRQTMGYYAYDVTGFIRNGNNCIGAILSPGWWTGPMTFTTSNFNFYGDHEALLVKLVVEYTDGSREVIISEPDSWKVYNDGPIRYGTFFHGERYDASKEEAVSVNGNPRGWALPSYDDTDWAPAEVIGIRDWIDFQLMARYDRPVHEVERLSAVGVMPVHSPDGHTHIYDMGVNMVGVPSITFPAGWLAGGDTVIIRYAEQLYPGLEGDDPYYIDTYGEKGRNIAGTMLYETYRAALATDFYIAASDREATYMPTTTYRGYQYIQITLPGHAGPLPLENVAGVVLSSDEGQTGTYHARTTDGRTGELVNRLFANMQRSQMGNFFTIPTDCPQRNERMGWTGDAQVYVRTGTYNSDSRNFFRQWMAALRNDQGVGSREPVPEFRYGPDGPEFISGTIAVPGGIGSTVPTYNKAGDPAFADGTTWAAAVCMVPWQLFLQYGDTQVIGENIEAMMDWLNGMAFYSFGEDYPDLSSKTTGLADWLAIDDNTPADMVNNAIYIYSMEITAKMAEVIGKGDYSEMLRARREKALAQWNDLYVDPVTGKTRNRHGGTVHSQSSYAVPLNFNIFTDRNRTRAAEYLAELAARPSRSGRGEKAYPPYSITTGFSGTPNILPALSRTGHAEEAYRMFTCTEPASWLYPVTKGATSIWERWDGYEKAFGERNENHMNSFNHFALGAVGQWMYEYSLGITTDRHNPRNGYKHFVLQPSAGSGFESVSGSYESNYGTIRSGWTADGKGNILTYAVTVPANTTATVFLPVTVSSAEAGQFVTFCGVVEHNGVSCAKLEVKSGEYTFEVDGDVLKVN